MPTGFLAAFSRKEAIEGLALCGALPSDLQNFRG